MEIQSGLGMGDVKIIDNFLTKTYYKKILELMSGPNFEWWYSDNISNSNHKQIDAFNEYGFSHYFWHPKYKSADRFSSFIEPMLYQIKDATDCDLIWRARADMVTWTGKEDFIHLAHIDFPFPNKASVFYVNETDGDTIFYNVKRTDNLDVKNLKEYDRISPKANRLIIFDGDLLHTGCSPIKHKNRIIINSNYIKKEYKEMAEGHLQEAENAKEE